MIRSGSQVYRHNSIKMKMSLLTKILRKVEINCSWVGLLLLPFFDLIRPKKLSRKSCCMSTVLSTLINLVSTSWSSKIIFKAIILEIIPLNGIHRLAFMILLPFKVRPFIYSIVSAMKLKNRFFCICCDRAFE